MATQSDLMRRRARRCLAALLLLPVNALAVTYTGQWNNSTFGSFNDASIEVVADAVEASVTIDLQGTVFGFGNPAPVTIAGPINAGVASLSVFDEPFFGDIQGTIDIVGGAVDIAISNLPTSGPPPDFSQTGDIVGAVTVTGIVSALSVNLDYIVLFNCDGSPCDGPGVGVEGNDWARGTIVATAPVPVPPAGLLILPAFAVLGRLRQRR